MRSNTFTYYIPRDRYVSTRWDNKLPPDRIAKQIAHRLTILLLQILEVEDRTLFYAYQGWEASEIEAYRLHKPREPCTVALCYGSAQWQEL